MPKRARFLCLEPKCARVCTSRRLHPNSAWCTCGKYLLPDQIELPRKRIDHGFVDLWAEATVQLSAGSLLRRKL